MLKRAKKDRFLPQKATFYNTFVGGLDLFPRRRATPNIHTMHIRRLYIIMQCTICKPEYQRFLSLMLEILVSRVEE